MNPLHPRAAFSTSHVVALVLLGIDALAHDLRSMASQPSQSAHVEPDDFDLALLGLCALGDRVHSFAGSTEPLSTMPDQQPNRSRHEGRALR